jgi:ABC-type transport system involved in multi-copper enzyme maturation permease subunit
MLWHKAWIDTRWRFLIGLVVLVGLAIENVFYFSSAQTLNLGAVPGAAGWLADQLREIAHLSQSFGGYIWVQFVRQNLAQPWIILAALLGADGLVSGRRGGLFTLSLPVSRSRLCAVRVATDLAELALLALVPMGIVSVVAPAVGHAYALADALVYGIGVFLGGAVFYALALWLSTVFNDRWRPIVISLAVAAGLIFCRNLTPALSAFSPVSVMAGESYFRTGEPAWAGLLAWPLVSAGLIFAAVRSIQARDF